MKRFSFITVLCGASILAIWMIFQGFAVSPANTKGDNEPFQVQDKANQAAIPVAGAEARKVAPVFDATGAVLSDPTGTILGGIHSADVKIAPIFDTTGAVVSDPTGTILSASEDLAIPLTGADLEIAPVYDATGALMSDPTGTIWNATHSRDMVVPVTGANMKIAPVFDATGAIVSDPTGTLWNSDPN